MSVEGALLFGRYAFPPNRLGYCGPEDYQALFDYVASHRADQGLLELERRFEGAYPYLKLIAAANHLADPFDRRVVEAYWIGNSCLKKVGPRSFYQSLDERFRARTPRRTFEWLASKVAAGAKPHHNFHVFEVYTRAGLMKDDRAPILLKTMDNCRISWGKVVGETGPELLVERPALALQAGKLALTWPVVERVARQFEGRGFADQARTGDFVSIHWNWACEVLTPGALQRLIRSTHYYLKLANQTL